MPDTQLNLPFALDEQELNLFLTQWVAIENEEDRLREEKRLLKEQYADHFPMRAVLTAVKVVRAKRKLEEHPKEPMRRVHQTVLENLVEQKLSTMDAAQALADLQADGRLHITMTTGEVPHAHV